MVSILTALSIALLLTALFSFRLRNWNSPGLLAGYFVTFAMLEWVGQHYFIPPDAMGFEIALVCFPLAILFIWIGGYFRRLEDSVDDSVREES